MRKIETIETAEKKKKRNTFILSMLMLFILLSGTLGFAFLINGPSNSNTNEEIVIPKNNQESLYPSIKYQGLEVELSSTLKEIEDVPVEINITPEEFLETLYIDSDNQIIYQELISILGRFSTRVQQACYGKCEENFPEKDCSTPMIVVQEAEENKVYQEDKCVFINGDLSSADAFLYNLFR